MKWHHKNIIKFYQSFKAAQFYYFLLELCEKGSLNDYLAKNRTWSLEVARYFAASIVNGLEYLHNEGIVHRDIKPSNILLNNNYDVKLIDFGTAKIINCKDARILRLLKEREDQESTFLHHRKGTFVGTHEYISPEVLNSEDVSPLIDIWGLGIIIYEMLHGHTPFIGETEMLTYINISEGKVKLREGLNQDAADFILKCLKVNVEDRIGYTNEGNLIDYEKIKSHKFFDNIDFENLDPLNIKSLEFINTKKKSENISIESQAKFNHIRMKTPTKNSEAYSTMDSCTNPKCVISLENLR